MQRCHACESTHDVLTVGDLNWCADCRDGDLPELYASGASPMFTSAIVAERARRVPTPRDDKRFKRNDEKV